MSIVSKPSTPWLRLLEPVRLACTVIAGFYCYGAFTVGDAQQVQVALWALVILVFWYVWTAIDIMGELALAERSQSASAPRRSHKSRLVDSATWEDWKQRYTKI